MTPAQIQSVLERAERIAVELDEAEIDMPLAELHELGRRANAIAGDLRRAIERVRGRLEKSLETIDIADTLADELDGIGQQLRLFEE
jgi:hypothetical protein